MLLSRVAVSLVLGSSLAFSQMLPADENEKMSPQEDALEQLLSERESQEAFDQQILRARSLGVAEQAILEARFLFYVDRAEDDKLAALLPEFLERKDKFDLMESEIFGSVDDWLAVTEYVQALAALEKGDKDGFKKHITEAFWLSPRQGAAFAPHIDRIRLMDAMKAVRVDFQKSYKDILKGETLTLGEVLGENKGMLLHFWSPWSRECEATLGDFFVSAEYLSGKGVSVVSVLPETSDKVIGDAKKMLLETEKNIPGTWIVDTEKVSVSIKLKVQSVPTVVLVTAEGAVLFNGHPTDENFWKALATINPEITRPEMRD